MPGIIYDQKGIFIIPFNHKVCEGLVEMFLRTVVAVQEHIFDFEAIVLFKNFSKAIDLVFVILIRPGK
jgi:hypothetical protein